MSDAVVLVSSDTSYLERKLASLNYYIYPIDEFNHKNIHKLGDIDFTNNFINMVLSRHNHPCLIYGSGLEDKKNIYKLLSNNFIIKGNDLNMLSKFSDMSTLKLFFDKYNFKDPDSFEQEDSKKKYIWKPFNSSGGYGISYNVRENISHYKQRYIPGTTLSISFICNDKEFKFLGFNKLFLLSDCIEHPFIHAGAMMTKLSKDSKKIITSFSMLAKDLNLKGYNNIDFKLINNEIYILDINPRISSTFKIYNDLYQNDLLKIQINQYGNSLNNMKMINNNIYGYIHLFAKEDFNFKKCIHDVAFTNLPKDGECIKKGDPIFSVYMNASSENDLISKFEEKILNLRNYYYFYDILFKP